MVFYIQIAIIAFFATQLYILGKMGLKHFRYYDVYKLIFPIYIYLHLKEDKSTLSVLFSAINATLFGLIIAYFLV